AHFLKAQGLFRFGERWIGGDSPSCFHVSPYRHHRLWGPRFPRRGGLPSCRLLGTPAPLRLLPARPAGRNLSLRPLIFIPHSAISLAIEVVLRRPISLSSFAGISPILARVFGLDRKSTRLNSSHVAISYAVFCLKKKTELVALVAFQVP